MPPKHDTPSTGRPMGRPPKNRSKRRFYDGHLHALLLKRLAHVEGIVDGGRIDPAQLAAQTGRCRFTAYRWLGDDHLSPPAARAIIKLSCTEERPEGTLSIEDLASFLVS